jgi:VanZ family protein
MSTSESDSAVALLAPLLNALGITDSGVATHIVRKTAHFSEYALLGFLNLGMMQAWAKDTAWAYRLAAIPWLMAPCIDETIQLFVPGRDGRFTDVLIDLSGGLLGILIMHLLLRRFRASRA